MEEIPDDDFFAIGRRIGLSDDEFGVIWLASNPWPIDYGFLYSLLDDAPAAGFQKEKVESVRSSLTHMQADGLDERLDNLQGLPVWHGRDQPLPKVDPNIEIEHHYLAVAEGTGQAVDIVRKVNQSFLANYLLGFLKSE